MATSIKTAMAIRVMLINSTAVHSEKTVVYKVALHQRGI